MPKKVEEIVKALKRQGKSDKQAWAIAQATYKKLKAKKKRTKK